MHFLDHCTQFVAPPSVSDARHRQTQGPDLLWIEIRSRGTSVQCHVTRSFH